MKATGEGTSWWAQSVKKCVCSDYVHTDRLGSVVNLTDQYGRVPAQNDDVLGMYYAKARMYDAENRRFAAVDPVKGRITEPMTMVQYLYVVDDPLRWVDPLGLTYFLYMKDLNGHVLAKKELKFTNYIDDNWVHVREVEELISQAPGYRARVGYDSSTKQASFSVDTGANGYDMTVDIKKMNVPFWGLGTPVESNKVYFNFYNCWGNDKTLVDIKSLGDRLGVVFEIEYIPTGWRFIGGGLQFELSARMSNGFTGIIGVEVIFYVVIPLTQPSRGTNSKG